jgi:histidinol-phosphate aminotransferase
MFVLEKILRENIKNLVPYTSARDEFKGKEGVFLDANENAWGSATEQALNRYPDPLQLKLKAKISAIKGLPVEKIFLGNGSDEAIDLCFRAFCAPGKDNVIIVPPTYGMYEVSAAINDVAVIKVSLSRSFQLNLEAIIAAVTENTKLIIICSPNNPTGNAIPYENIVYLLKNFNGIVLVDEAYIDFANQNSLIQSLSAYPNLVILQTFSKAWGMAAIRIGMAFAGEEIIKIFNKIKPPYNINGVSQELALEALENQPKVDQWIKETQVEREKLMIALRMFDVVKEIYPSDANFILVKAVAPKEIYNYLVTKGIIVRDRSKISLCEGCLRITVGTTQENQYLIDTLKNYKV